MTMMPYQLTDIIGRGTHGRVYRGFHMSTNKTVAIKITPKTIASSKEVEMIQRVQYCRHVVKYIEHFEFENDYALVMEEVVGIDGSYMKDLSRHGMYLTEKEIRVIAKQICEMIFDCHERTILYGDMKPQNYIYSPPNTIKIVDFGCTRKGVHFKTPLGTPFYFSPQKFHHSYGLKSDIWSIGILMYELTCGHHPFAHQCDSKDMLFQQILSTKLTFHHPQWDSVSASMQDLIRQMLDKTEESRISARDILQHPWWTMPL
jgi:serine/threonine protein kinase